jgi:hypothetical protein
MRYAKWNLLFTDDVTQGATTPVELIGAFYCNPEQTQIAGYLPDDLDINTLSNWQVQQITQQQFLDLLLLVNPQGELRDGKVWIPPIVFEN